MIHQTRGQLIHDIEDIHASICEALDKLEGWRLPDEAIRALKSARDLAAESLSIWEMELEDKEEER
jgi:hypothetical protein